MSIANMISSAFILGILLIGITITFNIICNILDLLYKTYKIICSRINRCRCRCRCRYTYENNNHNNKITPILYNDNVIIVVNPYKNYQIGTISTKIN